MGDNVRAQARLLDSLGIRKLRLVLGGSIGGMQALDWAILNPDRVEKALVIGVAPVAAMGLALNHLQRGPSSTIRSGPRGVICPSGRLGAGWRWRGRLP